MEIDEEEHINGYNAINFCDSIIFNMFRRITSLKIKIYRDEIVTS